jgi:hypothetical protein
MDPHHLENETEPSPLDGFNQNFLQGAASARTLLKKRVMTTMMMVVVCKRRVDDTDEDHDPSHRFVLKVPY